MMFPCLRVIIISVAVQIVAAQQCQPDVLVDDFRQRDATMFRLQPPGQGCETQTGFGGCNKTLNLLGGDYGDSGCEEALDIGRLIIKAGYNPNITNLEAESHPNTDPSFNYWFAKFNWENDFDLTAFRAIQIDLIASTGSNFNVTLTQWIPRDPSVRDGAGVRGIDSSYHPLSSYLTSNGQLQSLVMPLSDFTTNTEKGSFDLAHLKDLTLVNFVPRDSVFIFKKIILLGNCSTTSSTTLSSSSASQTSQDSTSSSTTSPAVVITTSTKSNGAAKHSSFARLEVYGLVLFSLLINAIFFNFG